MTGALFTEQEDEKEAEHQNVTGMWNLIRYHLNDLRLQTKFCPRCHPEDSELIDSFKEEISSFRLANRHTGQDGRDLALA